MFLFSYNNGYISWIWLKISGCSGVGKTWLKAYLFRIVCTRISSILPIIYIIRNGFKGNQRPITKTRLFNFDPFKPHVYIVKLGITGYTLVSLFCQKNIDCGYSFEPPRRGGSNEYPQSMFWAEIWKKYLNFLSENFPFFGSKIFVMWHKWGLGTLSRFPIMFYNQSHLYRFFLLFLFGMM